MRVLVQTMQGNHSHSAFFYPILLCVIKLGCLVPFLESTDSQYWSQFPRKRRAVKYRDCILILLQWPVSAAACTTKFSPQIKVWRHFRAMLFRKTLANRLQWIQVKRASIQVLRGLVCLHKEATAATLQFPATTCLSRALHQACWAMLSLDLSEWASAIRLLPYQEGTSPLWPSLEDHHGLHGELL